MNPLLEGIFRFAFIATGIIFILYQIVTVFMAAHS